MGPLCARNYDGCRNMEMPGEITSLPYLRPGESWFGRTLTSSQGESWFGRTLTSTQGDWSQGTCFKPSLATVQLCVGGGTEHVCLGAQVCVHAFLLVKFLSRKVPLFERVEHHW